MGFIPVPNKRNANTIETKVRQLRKQELHHCQPEALQEVSFALSKRGFIIAKEELAKYLFLEPPKINLQEETKAIVAYMKALFPGEDADNPLSQLADSDKAFILESYIEKKLTEVIKRNVLGYYKVSTEMDSDLYKAVCRDQ